MERIIGLILMAAGLILRITAKRTLDRNWSYNKLSRPVRIEMRGIYQYVRHPSYLGAMLIVLGGCMIHPAVGLMFITLGFYESRVHDEETALMHYHPGYKRYKEETGSYFPKLKTVFPKLQTVFLKLQAVFFELKTVFLKLKEKIKCLFRF